MAGGAASPQTAEALEKLCRAYWYPLYAFVRRKNYSPEDAQDLTQEFFAHLLARCDLAVATPEKGRFRSYLLGAMKHFLADQWDKSRAVKRGGGAPVFSLDGQDPEARYVQEIPSAEVPEREFDRCWARTVLDQALVRLRGEYSNAGRKEMFDALKGYLVEPPESGEYEAAAEQLKTSPGAIAVAVHRLRKHYGELVRAEIGETVESPAEIEAELRQLLDSLR